MADSLVNLEVSDKLQLLSETAGFSVEEGVIVTSNEIRLANRYLCGFIAQTFGRDKMMGIRLIGMVFRSRTKILKRQNKAWVVCPGYMYQDFSIQNVRIPAARIPESG